MVVTPGSASNNSSNDKAANLLAADEDGLTKVDPINYPNELAPDAGGRFTLPVLIPGATYRLIDYPMSGPRPDRPGGPQGIHRQAGRDAQPRRYTGRQARDITPARHNGLSPVGCRGSRRYPKMPGGVK